MELYPNIINYKKINYIIKIMLPLSILVAGVNILINLIVDPSFLWSLIVLIGIIYGWITVLTSIRTNINIAKTTIIQLVTVSVICFGIDLITKYRNWSVDYAIPIGIITANFTIFILTIIYHKKHTKYFRYELIVFILSMFPAITMIAGWNEIWIIPVISLGIAFLNLINSSIVCRKEILEELKKVFHI